MGSLRFAALHCTLSPQLLELAGRLEHTGQTVVVVVVDGNAAGLMGLVDTLRDDAQQVLAALSDLGGRPGGSALRRP